MASEGPMRPHHKRPSGRRTLVLCFDGTGNKFQGNAGDSNVIKIFSCLDREDPNQHHYYQPGIGTYTSYGGLSHTSHLARIRSWLDKAKASAIGTGFEEHVMGGYKFLMRYYQPGDDVYFFGFSRGAYTARFLAQMLDYVGLLAPGNEELQRFAWKTFARWQQCTDGTEAERKQKAETYEFMRKFRQTFSVPVRRLRFLGLFDTVNSVAAFEGAFLQRRTKFPYTAKSSSKVIRHAVSIDERRAKFRQDLLGQKKPEEHQHPHLEHLHHMREHLHHYMEGDENEKTNGENGVTQQSKSKPTQPAQKPEHDRFQPRSSGARLNVPTGNAAASSRASIISSIGADIVDEDQDGVDDNLAQDIQEVWFPGCHADIGGGWPLEKGEEIALSHPPLVWMIREAWRAGLPFDIEALREQNFLVDEEIPHFAPHMPNEHLNRKASDFNFHDAKEAQTPGLHGLDGAPHPNIPVLEIDGRVTDEGGDGPDADAEADADANAPAPEPASSAFALRRKAFIENHSKACAGGRIHDVLQKDNGVGAGAVLSWNVMEWLPFRRMDLLPDGSWTAIRWPLPRGETRDMPPDAWVHSSALRRMEADPKYRPGNLIVGGGGRGLRTAPTSAKIGEWTVIREEGDVVGEVVVRKNPAVATGSSEKKKK